MFDKRSYAQIFVDFLAFSTLMINISAAQCPHVPMHGKRRGVIKSPNYPSTYPNDRICSWDIRVPKGLIIKLSFKDFLTERNFACSSDYVKVFDGPDESAIIIGKYCGGMQPFTVETTKNTMYIKFVSDRSLAFRGFRAEFRAVKKKLTTTNLPTTVNSINELSTQMTILPKKTNPTTTKQPTVTTTTIPPIPVTSIPVTKKQTVHTVTLQPITREVLTFNNPLGNFTIAVGLDRKFVCHIKGTRKRVPITWTRNTKIVTEDTERISIRYHHRRKSVLLVEKATKADSGVYGCHAGVGMKDVASKTMYGFLRVMSPPIIVQGPLSQKVFAGETVKLTCRVAGDPPLTIRWYINGVDSSQYASMDLKHTSTLSFRAKKTVKVECMVSNDVGRISQKAVASVLRAPITTSGLATKIAMITVATLNQTADIGTNVTLRCSATGTPPMKIRWFIDGNYYDGEQVRGKENIYTSFFKLTIKKEYTMVKCLAQNPYGIDNRSGVIRPKHGIKAVSRSPWDQFKPGRSMFYILIVGAMATLILVLLGVVCFRRHRTSNRYKPPSPVRLELLTKNPIFERNSNTYINPKLEKWELHRNNIEFVKDLEDGAFSRLFLGKMTHASRGEQDAIVMVKVRKESVPTPEVKDAFEEEAIVLTTYDHPNVQSLLGVCVIGRPLCLILESTDRGDLNQFLRDCGCSHYIIRERPTSSMDPDSNKLSHLDQLCIAKQIASGMEYLASKGYIHKQLCTKNCIISKNMIVKVANLGISDAGPTTGYFRLGPIQKSKYPVRWLPLESINTGVFNDNTDIWSYGIVLWEVYSYGMTPYYGMNNDEVITLVREGDILPKPKECPREMYSIMQDCWSLVPHERPRFRFLHQKISALFTGVAV